MRFGMGLAAVLAVAAAGVTGCGTETTDRTVTGAGIGAGAGAVAGPPGAIIGGIAGGAAGATTKEDDVNLGKPVWDWDPELPEEVR